MRFAPNELHLDCASLLRTDEPARREAVAALAAEAVQLVHQSGFVVFRIGRLRLGADDSRALAHAVCETLREALVGGGAPSGMRIEYDRAQETHVPEGFGTRTLLPHHDGQHCSYLTPSTEDVPDWRPEWREFGDRGYTTTPAHKMYQGVFIADPGDGLSVTTYYDWLDLVTTVGAERLGLSPERVEPRQVAQWLAGNLRVSLQHQAEHGTLYPSMGGMLGATDPMWHGLGFHYAEGPLSEQDRAAYPSAVALTGSCPCGDCVGETERLFCHQMLAATGRDWRECRRRWEVLAPSERFDLLFGHNLTMLHGGLAGGSGRVIEPLCLVIDDPRDKEYEGWLAASWRRQLPDLPGDQRG